MVAAASELRVRRPGTCFWTAPVPMTGGFTDAVISDCGLVCASHSSLDGSLGTGEQCREGCAGSLSWLHILRLGEHDPDTSSSDPSIVHADFDGDGHLDYAILLKSDTSGAAKLAVLLCDASTQCQGVSEEDITGYSEEAYLSPLPVGSRVAEAESAEGENESHPVKLTNSGIQVTYFEKGTVAYYWDKKVKKIVAVGTGE